MILLTNILVVVGTGICLIYDKNNIALFVGRFIYGMSGGAFAVYCTKYISEIAPTEIQGPIGGLS